MKRNLKEKKWKKLKGEKLRKHQTPNKIFIRRKCLQKFIFAFNKSLSKNSLLDITKIIDDKKITTLTIGIRF